MSTIHYYNFDGWDCYMKNIYRYLVLILIFCSVFILSGCSALNFRQEYDKGVRFYNEKKYANAIDAFNNALTYKPDSYSTMCLLGASYAYKKDYKMAETTFIDATKLFPDNWNAYVFLGELKHRQKDYVRAIEYYEIAVTLESMGGKEKTYYKKLLAELKNEQAAIELKQLNNKRIVSLKNEVDKKDSNDETLKNMPKKQTGDIILQLDKNKWEKALTHYDEKAKVIQYGLKGEDVKNSKWSQLVITQYFVLTDNFNTTLDTYFKNHVGAIEAISQNAGKSFEKKILSQNNHEIYYEWSFDASAEEELARIVYTQQGIYHIHFAKKGKFTPEERELYMGLLKSVILE